MSLQHSLVVGLSTDIGRGHQLYLDCVWRVLLTKLPAPSLHRTTVFELSLGSARAAWRLARQLYLSSGKNPILIPAYNRLRSGSHDSRLQQNLLRLMGRDIVQALGSYKGICLTDHQLTSRILSSQCRTWYLHADPAAPTECAVPGAERIFVPLAQTEQELRAALDRYAQPGHAKARVVTTGLLVEPELIPLAHQAFHSRLTRLTANTRLRVGFFTSGAYPRSHIRKLLLGIQSALDRGHTVVVFAGTDRSFLRHFLHWGRRLQVQLVVNPQDPTLSDSETKPSLIVISWPERTADSLAQARFAPYLDCIVAAAHERTNWALGLGIPLFALFPMIGTHAQMNYEICFKANVAFPLRTEHDAASLGETIDKLREDGALANMARCGFGCLPINGAERVAQEIIGALESSKGHQGSKILDHSPSQAPTAQSM